MTTPTHTPETFIDHNNELTAKHQIFNTFKGEYRVVRLAHTPPRSQEMDLPEDPTAYGKSTIVEFRIPQSQEVALYQSTDFDLEHNNTELNREAPPPEARIIRFKDGKLRMYRVNPRTMNLQWLEAELEFKGRIEPPSDVWKGGGERHQYIYMGSTEWLHRPQTQDIVHFVDVVLVRGFNEHCIVMHRALPRGFGWFEYQRISGPEGGEDYPRPPLTNDAIVFPDD